MSEHSLATSLSSNVSLNSGSLASTNSSASLTVSMLHQQLLRIISSNQSIFPMKDTFYSTLAKERFPFAFDREMEFQVLEKAQESIRGLTSNEVATSNINDLLSRFSTLIDEFNFKKDPSIEILNLSSYLSIFCRLLLSHGDGDGEKYFPKKEIVSRFFKSLCSIIILLPVKTEATLQLVVESLRLMIILMSEQILSTKISNSFYLHTVFSNSSISPESLFFRLLHLARLQKDAEASTSFSITTAILHPISSLFQPRPLHFMYLSKLSLHFVALLSVQKSNLPIWSEFLSSWKEPPQTSLHFSYTFILETAVMFLETVSGATLFYELLNRNSGFRNFLLSRTDPDFLLLPVLKFLFHKFQQFSSTPTETNSQTFLPPGSTLPYSHIYILLVSLVLLTLDFTYVDTLMNTFLDPSPSWLSSDTVASRMSLGSLLAYVTLKIMQINIQHERDPFLHANAVAILTNVSRCWKNIHTLVALKFVNWFESVSKRFLKLKASSENECFSSNASGFEYTYSSADLVIYTDILTLLLNVFHCALHVSYIRYNPNLICALLPKEALFEQISTSTEFSDLVFPLKKVMEFFKTGISGQSLISDKLYQHVLDFSKTVGSNYPIQNKITDLAFEFIEDVNSDAFFIPLMWSIIFKETCAWDRIPTLLYQFENSEMHAMGFVYESLDSEVQSFT